MRLMPVLRQQQGSTLIEVLVTFLIIAIGLLGLGALQISTMNNQFESYQRAQVTALVDDMAARIRINPTAAKAGTYTAQTGAYWGLQSTTPDCTLLTGAPRDLCEWNETIAGVAVVDENDINLGAPLGARGCMETRPVSGSGEVVIRVAIAWQGVAEATKPSIDCGKDAFGDEKYRRAVYRDVAVR